jgi:hypothetical protein
VKWRLCDPDAPSRSRPYAVTRDVRLVSLAREALTATEKRLVRLGVFHSRLHHGRPRCAVLDPDASHCARYGSKSMDTVSAEYGCSPDTCTGGSLMIPSTSVSLMPHKWPPPTSGV